MSTQTTPHAVVRADMDGERRWFAGGGMHTWKVHSEETGGAFMLFEHRMEQGKQTPLHTHPDSDETMIVLEGEIVMHMDGVDHRVGRDGVAVATRGLPHAFMVTSPFARLLCLHTPGCCEAFYRDASDLAVDGEPGGAVDFDRVRSSAARNGGIELLGPPPFTQS
ncbi:cupin domain-containing protein [Aeromicrobium sp. A1-2]|uniref:cupin domain-containing protein n=1 Tax=Aeromicrobium sp. A1-2 TaxID=2107713 RepID=UPI000E55701F|nr:cupin domain-containing protein [Aeromicrobium sp. A1-2]AXT85441.1 cupin domain-containing protein [Aeromicrobium sp. A1-2]